MYIFCIIFQCNNLQIESRAVTLRINIFPHKSLIALTPSLHIGKGDFQFLNCVNLEKVIERQQYFSANHLSL